jgi:septal ring factor EnvC (AmiA/AmiB activator)
MESQVVKKEVKTEKSVSNDCFSESVSDYILSGKCKVEEKLKKKVKEVATKLFSMHEEIINSSTSLKKERDKIKQKYKHKNKFIKVKLIMIYHRTY